MAKMLTELPAGGGSITRRGLRQNFPVRAGSSSVSAPSRCTERHSRMKTDYILVSNGGDMSHPFAVICATIQRPPFTPLPGRHFPWPYPRAAMCFSSVLTVGELVAVNNIVTVNFRMAEFHIVALPAMFMDIGEKLA